METIWIVAYKVSIIVAGMIGINWWVGRSENPLEVLQNKNDELKNELNRVTRIKNDYMDRYYELLRKSFIEKE